MLEVPLKSKSYFLPENWSEIKLRQFKNIMLIDDKQEELSYKIDVLSELLQCNIEDLEQSSLNSLNSLWIKAEALLNSKPDDELPGIITLQGREFYFDSALDKQTYGMFCDASTLRQKEDFWQVCEKVLAIYIRPVIKKKLNFSKWLGWNKSNYQPKAIDIEPYDSDKLDEHAALLLEACMQAIYPTCIFFWSLLKELQNNIHQSSTAMMNQKLMTELMNQNKEELTKILYPLSTKLGDFTVHSTH